jgi:predicted dehydrogenase
MIDRIIKLGVVGCGDVAFRRYLPALATVGDKAQVVACYDPVRDRAERAAAFCARWSPDIQVYTSYAELLQHEGMDAIVNLTPATFHGEVNAAALDANLHVFSEKPLAGSVEDAQALIAQARERQRLLLCAPAVMATNRFQWLQGILASGRIGRPTLATGQMANMGPASWRAYTGDPSVFYSAAVGPMLDTGVYLLHAITGVLGSARRVQSMGGVAIPQRTVTAGRLAGQLVDVAAHDHMLVQLDFGNNTFAQILSSFAVPATKAPVLELYCTHGSVSISDWYNINHSIDLFMRDESALGVEGWLNVAPPNASPVDHLIGVGPVHFVACLRGEEQPILTAEHGCHVLEIIIKAGESVQQGRAIELETRF